ncbi:MAG: phosphoribosylanthranilate isomerase [Candidatus Marinimicrobia bacterium]|nr:phosphoribosylanthranilate isomerase [Candidatus Neomarinimicrobiota bacterium]MCF7922746.1 phosphoribosylanthranilate isomerase [Candidatus Neomarinimicrobiota bacterium]
MSGPLVKVCCIRSLAEAKMALQAGADLLGMVSEMPSGPGIISLEKIAGIVAGLPGQTKTILLSSKRSCKDILDQHNFVKTWGIQLVDTLPEIELKKLRKRRPKTYLIQVIHVRGKEAVGEALIYDNLVDSILLDSGNPHNPKRTLGGTGEIHDWQISREICARTSLPVFLAGGLKVENISEAINLVQPHGVDLCSGVRTHGNLDREKLISFMGCVREEQRK